MFNSIEITNPINVSHSSFVVNAIEYIAFRSFALLLIVIVGCASPPPDRGFPQWKVGWQQLHEGLLPQEVAALFPANKPLIIENKNATPPTRSEFRGLFNFTFVFNSTSQRFELKSWKCFSEPILARLNGTSPPSAPHQPATDPHLIYSTSVTYKNGVPVKSTSTIANPNGSTSQKHTEGEIEQGGKKYHVKQTVTNEDGVTTLKQTATPTGQ